jgi:hypothetical protein
MGLFGTLSLSSVFFSHSVSETGSELYAFLRLEHLSASSDRAEPLLMGPTESQPLLLYVRSTTKQIQLKTMNHFQNSSIYYNMTPKRRNYTVWEV